jgi:YegS/Rv2252/BmrU family lipid kinase
MPTRVLLLLNPGARKVDDDPREVADMLRERGLDVVYKPFEDPQRIDEIIRQHAGAVDRVVVGGGDGTLGAATQSLVDTGLPLGILPLGTANNVARTLGIPDDFDRALDIAVGDVQRRIDVGAVNGRCFLTTASFGLSVAITEELTSDVKARWGRLAYVWSAARVVRRAKPLRVQIRWPGGELATRTVQVVVGNGRYYGTALQVADDAAIDDHALDLYSIEVRHWWQLLALGPALKRGTHGKRDAVHTARAREFKIVTATPCAIDADGELIAETPATFRVLPDALTVFAPVAT